MTSQDFVARCLLLDLETDLENNIFRIGAAFRDRSLEKKGRFNLHAALAELDTLAGSARYLLGHNLLGHDLPILAAKAPGLALLQKPVIDTLYLSPLAFPENPYHRLVKNYKLVRDALNDPVADARLAASVFNDQWQSFAALRKTEPEVIAFYRFCFAGGGNLSLRGEGLAEVFAAIGAAEINADQALAVFVQQVRGKACNAAVMARIPTALANAETRPALAYCLAWLRVAGHNSVLPPWVRHRFRHLVPILKELREVPCVSPDCSWCRTTHHPREQLVRLFGYPNFRPTPAADDGTSLQEAIVSHGMRDKPLLAILPTGGGKSLCYQIPALVRNFRRGVLTVVISPLQALMKDQVDGLAAKTGTMFAAAIYGMLTPPERGDILERVRLGDIAILYISPEQLRNRSVTEAISQREIGCWVFDEAHCLSKWGHDFRPDYLYASRFIREFAARQQTPIPPIACFTATAKQDVIEEIADHFRRELGQELAIFQGGVERSNLSFEVQLVSGGERHERIHQILTEHLPGPEAGAAIIYAAKRNDTESIRDFLARKGWSVEAFHAGLEAPIKRRIQEDFLAGRTQVICATNAFGMGIDKDNVRLVIHANIPGSLENYLQEAGRAGRDTRDAECILLYNEEDIETQFGLEALSELSRHDISQILRGLRRARRDRDNQVVITSGELLRSEEVQTRFESNDPMADTKVKTAVSWLERAGFVERNQNNTRVFQGLPLVRSLEEAEKKIAPLDISRERKKRWLAILQALFNATPDEGMSADELAELPEYKGMEKPAGPLAISGDTQLVLRDLHAMTEAGLIKQGILLNAFVRYKVKNHSQLRFDKVCRLEKAMLWLMQETEPEAEGWLDLSLRRLNQRLVDEGQESLPELLRHLLKSLAMDGRGLAGNRGSIEFRYFGQDHYRLKLNRDWPTLLATADKRRQVAGVILEAILARIPANTPPSGELLVNFSLDDLAAALRGNLFLAGQLKDNLAAIDRALMFLHEQQVVILQQGLAVFRQAMTIRIIPEAMKRQYLKEDFNPLAQHYKERIFQVHVMNEYAQLGLKKIRQALDLVIAYFAADRGSFIQRFFPGRKNALDRATSEDSFHRIVDNLANPVQMAVVTAAPQENLLVLAGPGSGKTRVVAHRCAYLLRVQRAQPRSILILCFNRNAASTLRRRLFDLVGPDARGVTVLTYHGLAMRLTGSSFAERAEGRKMQSDDLKTVIPEAVRLLSGEIELTCLESDELRERLLAGYRYILVDEYQDIDADQYRLISAMAGRTLSDPDSKLALLAVGDDDQNIYTFRGANVAFIRRFQKDYQATVHYLVENYRSTAHIIAAANALILHNRDRMKTGTAIRINQGRAQLPPGGPWEDLDPVARGRVQLLQVADAGQQAVALMDELLRLRRCNPALAWSDCAVLARTRDELAPIRSVCARQSIPVSWPIARDKTPPLHRIREIRQFIAELQSREAGLLSATEAMQIAGHQTTDEDNYNPWRQLLQNILAEWRQESADARHPVSRVIEYLYESLAEQKRDQTLGVGIFLSTVHAAKGMEFPHVFVPGGWGFAKNQAEAEEERRTYYVAMTRARETLCLFDRQDVKDSHTDLLAGDFICRREPRITHAPEDRLLQRRYAILGMEDLFLDYAGRLPPEGPVHRRLAALKPGDPLQMVVQEKHLVLLNQMGKMVARLSSAASAAWRERLSGIEGVTVLAMVERRQADSGDGYQRLCRCGQWEVPLAEITYLSSKTQKGR